MRILGIDPGIAGGFAVINGEGQLVTVSDTPPDLHDWIDVVERSYNLFQPFTAVFMERLWAMPRGFKAGWELAKSLRSWEFFLSRQGIDWYEIEPKKWQATIGKPKDAVGPEGKKWLIQKAKELHPLKAMRVNRKTADALLIAEVGRRIITKEDTCQSVENKL